MKKMTLAVLLCVALVLGSFIAWCFYLDILACLLFICSLIPSCLYEEGWREFKTNRHDA